MASVKGKAVYLSGPMTGIPRWNCESFQDAHARLDSLGAREVYDPSEHEWMQHIDHERAMRESVTELAMESDRVPNGSHTRPHYDLLVLLPGWESSDGCKVERMVAQACGIEVWELEDVDGGEDDG